MIIKGDNLIFATILAGGTGTRMGETEKPKQFLLLGEKPILIHTIEKFALNPKFDKIIILTPKEWINYTEDLVNKHVVNKENIIIVESGSTRLETLTNAINHILDNFENDDDNIIVTHDAVRPFVTSRIIEDNIKYAEKYGACDTVIPTTDTIVKSEDNKVISEIPNRAHMYQGQTPQSFNLNKLNDLLNQLTDEEKEILTDAAKIFTLKGEDVYLVKGEVSNFKITYPYDIKLANSIIS